MACNCKEQMNKLLEQYNTRLVIRVTLNQETGVMEAYPVIDTELITAARSAKPVSVLPSFCPFCGQTYKEAKDGL